MIFIHNSTNINVELRQQNKTGPETTELISHIGTCLNMLPPKQLGRFLRDAFLLHLEELQITCPDFFDFVSELTILLSRLDTEEDQQTKTIATHNA